MDPDPLLKKENGSRPDPQEGKKIQTRSSRIKIDSDPMLKKENGSRPDAQEGK